MVKQNVLIPGAGGAAAIGAIRSLRMCGFGGKMVATDANELSAGLYLADRGYVVPPADSPDFMAEAMKVIEKEKIDIILPTSGFDIVPYSKNKKTLIDKGITVFMSDYEVIENCMDKLKFSYKLKSRFNLPDTTTDPMQVNNFPCLVKPIRGKGSRDVFLCQNEGDLQYIFARYPNMLIQEYLPGKEYTIDILSDLDGKALCVIPREDIEVKAGITTKGRIVLDKKIQEECTRLVEYLGLKGASGAQMKCDKDGIPRITELNPRMCGATIMTTYAGVNLPELMVKMANGEKVTIPPIKELTMVRYYEEVMLTEKGKVLKI